MSARRDSATALETAAIPAKIHTPTFDREGRTVHTTKTAKTMSAPMTRGSSNDVECRDMSIPKSDGISPPTMFCRMNLALEASPGALPDSLT